MKTIYYKCDAYGCEVNWQQDITSSNSSEFEPSGWVKHSFGFFCSNGCLMRGLMAAKDLRLVAHLELLRRLEVVSRRPDTLQSDAQPVREVAP